MQPCPIHLAPNGWVPNHPRLPVLLYRAAMTGAPGDALATRMEQRFAANGWPSDWRDGAYDYHHYHSTTHEVLGIAGGSATLILGGPDGRRTGLSAGDILLLPAGTGHCRARASADFLVVGAYPAGQRWDVCRSAPDAATRERIATLPFPDNDPVEGAAGATTRWWTNA